MNIVVQLIPSEYTLNCRFTFDDLQITPNEWEKLSFAEKENVVRKAVISFAPKPYWHIKQFEERKDE